MLKVIAHKTFEVEIDGETVQVLRDVSETCRVYLQNHSFSYSSPTSQPVGQFSRQEARNMDDFISRIFEETN